MMTFAVVGDARQTRELPLLEPAMVVLRQVGHVPDDVVVVDAGPVAMGRGRRLGDDVDADQLAHAELRQPLADHAVPGAEVEDPEALERHALGES